MLVFFGTETLGYDVSQIAISGNIGEVDYFTLLLVATDMVPNVDILGLRA